MPEIEKANKALGQLGKKPLESTIELIGRCLLALWFLGDHMVWVAKLKVFPTLVTPHENISNNAAGSFEHLGIYAALY